MTDHEPPTRLAAAPLRIMTPRQVHTLPKPPAAEPPELTRAELRRVAESLVGLCAQILTGRRPLAVLRRRAEAAAFGQFAALHRRLHPGKAVSLSLRHNDTDASGGLTIVAMLRVGGFVRALSLCARHRGRAGWRLTQCRLVEPGRPVSGVGGAGGGAILMP